jgi:predicted lipoprotein with Yx(FWY)xxD motif
MPTMSHGAYGPTFPRRRPRRRSGLTALLAVQAFVTAVTVASASSGTLPHLEKSSSGVYSGILVTSSHRSLYALSVEVRGVIHCRSACTPIWPPFLVNSSVSTVTLGAGVKGKIGFIKRSATTKQVTFNGYPVYKYSGDSGPLQSNGEGIRADGGTWLLVRAGSTTSSTTLIKVHSSNTTTTGGGYNTTTTGGGYNY